MENQLNLTMKKIEQLQKDSDSCQNRLNNADKLISLLADEGKRWRENINLL